MTSELFTVTASEAKTSFPRRSKSLQSGYADYHRVHTLMRIFREKDETTTHQPCDSVVYVDAVEQVLRQAVCNQRFFRGGIHYG